MLTTPHAMIAIVIFLYIPNKFLAFFLALMSHFLFDFFFPHWNPHLFTELKNEKKLSRKTVIFIFYDALAAVIITLIVIYFKTWPNFSASVLLILVELAAVLPDLVEIPYYFLGSKNKILQKYVNFQHNHQADAGMKTDIASQVAVILFKCKKRLLTLVI